MYFLYSSVVIVCWILSSFSVSKGEERSAVEGLNKYEFINDSNKKGASTKLNDIHKRLTRNVNIRSVLIDSLKKSASSEVQDEPATDQIESPDNKSTAVNKQKETGAVLDKDLDKDSSAKIDQPPDIISVNESVIDEPVNESVIEEPVNESVIEEPVNESVIEEHENTTLRFEDTTTFTGGMNFWDFEGFWGKFNLSSMDESKLHVPDYETSLDHVILLTKTFYSPASIMKEYPAIEDGTITITYYMNFTKDIQVTGTAFNNETTIKVFNHNEKNSGPFNLMWTVEEYNIDIKSPFTFKIEVSSSVPSTWAVDVITLRGIKRTDIIDTTASNVTSIENEADVTEPTDGENENNSTILPNVSPEIPTNIAINDTEEETTSVPSTNDDVIIPEMIGNDVDDNDELDVGKIEEVASAMWNAFYVFLALFCACLIALIIMIVKQRCRDDPIPPPTQSYSPRSSTYQLRKPQENPAYQTDSV